MATLNSSTGSYREYQLSIAVENMERRIQHALTYPEQYPSRFIQHYTVVLEGYRKILSQV